MEWLTAVLYLAAAALAVVASGRLWRNERVYAVLYLVFAGGLFVIAGEEASWGQRVFDYATPEAVSAINEKDEFNFHNVSGFPLHLAFISVGLYGAFGRILLTPLLGERAPRALELLTAPRSLAHFFLLPALLYIYYELVPVLHDVPQGMTVPEFLEPRFVSGKEQEPFELMLGFGFFLFAVQALGKARTRSPV
ncbi:hypothetical protein [Tropicimonas marinistellae]|uniref:hypothetical protein n=1 Tax=Tropicimonas marinistellae TaxID=1739787 RepID=UPI00122E8E0F|nr:hypothetical protein [Tropicimonas marinistellae]